MISRSVCVIALIVVCVACVEEKKKNRFGDDTQSRIGDLQDRRSTDSLLAFLSSDDVDYREAAALALGSVQDTAAIDDLGKIPAENRRALINAAFALGQTSNPSVVHALYRFFRDSDPLVKSTAYEALGKVAGKNDLRLFADPSASFSGVTWGAYRAGIRGVIDSSTTSLIASILKRREFDIGARLGAAHYFARTQLPQTNELSGVLVSAASDSSAEIRMAVVSALSKLKPEESIDALAKATTDPDYRVRVNTARALRVQPWDVAKPHYEKLLADSNVHVKVATAEVLNQLSNLRDHLAIFDWARNATDWRTQATLYESLCKMSLMAEGLDKEIQDLYNSSKNQYQQAALLIALSNRGNTDFILDQFRKAETKVLKSTAASAIVRATRRGALDTKRAAEIYKEIIADGDQGAIIYACGALMDTTLGFKKMITDISFLEEAKSKLSLPKDYETYVPLQETFNYFKGLPPPPPLKNEYNHPIDWKLAATIGSDQKVTIKTTKGDIVMQLFIEEAPGSVVNFIKLINDRYYDGKYFHRVVPNFVIQTGCDRGDGFGSLDYSIRSEFSTRKYKTGSVGMASAGKDTEGVQWFITHSPTPHLDGKYTIFAEVVSGMDVVHKIEVGDQILSARLSY